MKIIAHRGASYTAPENTMSSFRLALAQGADGLETDIRLTADGRVIALHDDNTKRTCGLSYAACDTEYSVISSLDAGSWKCDEYRCERIPLLSEILDILPPGKEMYIEIKCSAGILKPLKELLDDYSGLKECAVIFGFDYDVLKSAAMELVGYRVMWIGEFGCNLPLGQGMYDTAEKMVKEGGFCGFSTKADRAHCSEMKKRLKGMMFNVWTVDDKKEADFYRQLGISSLTTNRPDIMK